MKRGAVKNRDAKLVTVWVPRDMARAIDQAVQEYDSDKSKFIRAAIRAKVRELGLIVPALPPLEVE